MASHRQVSRQTKYAELTESDPKTRASVVSGGLGFSIVTMHAGGINLAGRNVQVNQTQPDRQKPDIRDLVATIE